MRHLDTRPRLADPDAFYEALIDMHRDLSDDESQRVNAKLILLLANQVGDLDVLREAMALARGGAHAVAASPLAGAGRATQ
ncbi:hypothetical protein WS67_02010 [Burkholderia singularis]|uniref:DUF2783 domain-containing protein n=1 Tax=Burkholderia singularis TaxID=1503053 RepID=A0A118DM38_9BURK|nr:MULTISPECIES: DUF2783 domain-containing protein [Burkholderia]AOK28929.1 hypothetical protein AQ611_05255 [Burkholderia sp. Bp7605]KVE24414.1 hypothetical protein WS67_02010 [Burkholderia singularis]SMG01374.1 FIG00453142: hypothetical protein [Burkholderia singularis]